MDRVVVNGQVLTVRPVPKLGDGGAGDREPPSRPAPASADEDGPLCVGCGKRPAQADGDLCPACQLDANRAARDLGRPGLDTLYREDGRW